MYSEEFCFLGSFVSIFKHEVMCAMNDQSGIYACMISTIIIFTSFRDCN